MALIKVKNRSNGSESNFTQERWAEIQKDRRWANVWEVIEVPTPIEVVEAMKQQETETGQKSTQIENAPETKPQPKKRATTKKKQQNNTGN